MRFPFRSAVVALALAALLPLSACDETGGLQIGTPDEAVQDAVIARQAGDFASAETLLRGALAQAPSNASVRTELASTLMERDGLDLLDIDRIAQFLTNPPTLAAPTTPVSASKGASSCSFADEPGAVEFDPTTVDGFPAIRTSQATINEVLALLEPVIPQQIKTFDTCLSIVDGAFVYDHAAASRELRATGMSDQRIGSVLAVHALAKFLSAYLFVTTEVTTQTTWYRLSDGSIGVCAEDEDALRNEAEESVKDLGVSLQSLDLRSRSFVSGGNARTLVTSALDAFEEISDAVADYCSTGTI